MPPLLADFGSALKELERAGYIVRNRLRDSKGKIVDVEYVIYETPHSPDTGQPCEDEPDTACPDTENPDMDNPCLENRPRLVQIRKTRIWITHVWKTGRN